MSMVTLISIGAGMVTIAGGVVALVKYLQNRPSKTVNSDFLNLNMLGRHQEALIACKKAIRANPNDTSAYTNLSWAHNALGRHQEALDASQQAIHITPNNATKDGLFTNLDATTMHLGLTKKPFSLILALLLPTKGKVMISLRLGATTRL